MRNWRASTAIGNIPATLPPSKTVGIHSPVYVLENSIRSIMTGQGYHEAVNLSFASEADHPEFPPLEGERIAVRNPLTEDTQYMRTTLAPGLVRSAKRNFNYDQRWCVCLRSGRCIVLDPMEFRSERNTLGILGTGGIHETRIGRIHRRSMTFFHIKGVLNALLQGVRDSVFRN